MKKIIWSFAIAAFLFQWLEAPRLFPLTYQNAAPTQNFFAGLFLGLLFLLPLLFYRKK